ncbi:hypothetical protein ACFPAF_05265 [Hymenobacter endophyticus]|uniref:Uncharacterized protein n=1 Tax=Hymenobacter endophyticus TaxID=3076335 RepID=A0ABU3TEU6_9BACT|nr:hypothetical protein [Hymenobacter endophyticus]MDU0369795.1 hypothetical protein [Hymenobacter endophyticus]
MRKLLRLFCFSLIVWVLLLWLLLGQMALQATLDIQLHNTYFVVGSYAGQILLLTLTFLLMLAASSLKRQAKASKPLLVVLAGSSVVLELLLCIAAINTRFTIYPPLSPSPIMAVAPLSGILWGLHGVLLLTASWASIRLIELVVRPRTA